MKASELRIGNLLRNNLNGNILIPCDILCDGINTDRYEDLNYGFIEPIPLTEEWLLKFGFEKNLNSNNIIYYILAGKCLLEYNLTHNIADIVKKVHLDLFIEIKYVHQLQNLYFALTGEELTLKQN